MKRVVAVILDGLRRDFVDPDRTPRLAEFRAGAEYFRDYRTAFPSATRVVSATFTTGCHPARHTLQGNAVALVENGRLVPHDVGLPDFLDHKRQVTGCALAMPTLPERLATHGGAIVYNNVSPGAACAHDPDGYGYGPTPDAEKNFRRYLDEKCKPQLKELLTKYGDIGLIWFDTPQIMSYEHSKELKDYVKSLQPNCIVSGRIGNQLGEYMSTGDNRIPIMPFNGDWEVPATLNDTWGFKENDHNWKTPEHIIQLLLKINSRGGNYLLNVGPDSLGKIPKPSADILLEVGKFVKANADAVYGTRAVVGYPYDIENFFLTSRDNHLYLSYKGNQPQKIHLTMLDSKVKAVTMLATGNPVEFEASYAVASKSNRLIINTPENPPCEYFNTVAIEIEDKVPVFGTLENL